MPYVPSKKTGLSTGDDRAELDPSIQALAESIAKVSTKHGYDGAFQGELNYAITRLIQELPRQLVKTGNLKSDTRYWIQSAIFGVLFDIALEYKFRVNQAYEAAQILKSGDCYDTEYYSRLVEVKDKDGKLIGHTHVLMKRSDDTINKDVVGTLELK